MLPTNQWTFPLKFSSFTYYLVDLVGPCTDSFSYINPLWMLGWFGTLHWLNRWTCLVIPSFAVVVRWYTLVYVRSTASSSLTHEPMLPTNSCTIPLILVSFTYTSDLGALVGSPGNYSVPLPTNCLVCPASPYHLRHFIGVARHTPGQFPHIPNGYVDTPAPRVP